MSFHSSQELAADCSAPTCLDGVLSDTSSGTTTASESSPLESGTESWPPLQSSLTCVSSHSPVQPTNTEELRMWLQQAFPASHSLSEGSNSEKPTSETCGPQRQMSFAVFDRDASCWRTSQGSLFLDTSEQCSVIWPRWGSMHDGECWEVTTLEPPSVENESGYLPTPRASVGTHGICWKRAKSGDHRSQIEDYLASLSLNHGGQVTRGLTVNADFQDWLMVWPTGWSDLKPLGTDRFHVWRQSHINFSVKDEITDER
jgi:hypothetical protein